MFADFNKLVKNRKKTSINIPEPLIEYMRKQLTDGFNYEKIGNSYCIVPTSEGKYGGLIFAPNEEQKSILGTNSSYEEVLEYVYNSQTPIELIPQDGENIVLNGKELPLKKFTLSKTKHSQKFYLIPQNFVESFLLNLSVDDIILPVKMKRVPNNSIYERSFKSVDEIINLQIDINITTKQLALILHINLEEIDRINELLIAMKLCNAFGLGRLKLEGYLIEKKEGKRKEVFNTQTINYWEKLLKIEQCLNLQFKPDLEIVPTDLHFMVEKLYQSLINHEPICEIETMNSISGNFDTEDLKKQIGKPILFTFQGNEIYSIYGQKIQLFSRTFIFKCTVKKIEEQDGKSKIIIDDLNDKEHRYMSTLLFTTLEELENYDFNNNIKKFEKAKTYTELVRQ